MMTKFKVGDKVRAIKASRGWGLVDDGDEGVISKVLDANLYSVDFTSQSDWVAESTDLELLTKKPTKKQRIKALESEVVGLTSEVAELKAKVEALEKASAQPKFEAVTMDNIAVGDKIRVIDKDNIVCACDLTSGNIYVVTEVNNIGGIYIRDDEDDSLYIAVDELRAIEKVVSE